MNCLRAGTPACLSARQAGGSEGNYFYNLLKLHGI